MVDSGDMPAEMVIVPPFVLSKMTFTVPSSVNVVESPVQLAVVVSQLPPPATFQVMAAEDGLDGDKAEDGHGQHNEACTSFHLRLLCKM